MVDMSATLIHHGHIRILKSAKEIGFVIVALTTDKEILKKKGYKPELDFNSRKEILESIKYVDKVVPSPWLLDNSFLDKHRVELLVHGNDNSNPITSDRILVLDRTPGISSSILRRRVLKTTTELKKNKNN